MPVGKRIAVVVVAVTIAGAALPVSNAEAALMDLDGLYVFGDSLSDTGNVFTGSGTAIPPSGDFPFSDTYFDGRFSNGPIWVERMAVDLGLPGPAPVLSLLPPGPPPPPPPPPPPLLDIGAHPSVSFAFGGSGTGPVNINPAGDEVPGLLGQVGMFNQVFGGSPDGSPIPGTAPSEALYVVWSGANDFFFDPVDDLDFDPGLGEELVDLGFDDDPSVTTGNIELAIRGLYAAGARNFLVPNLPDLGATPLAHLNPLLDPATLSALTLDHNAALAAILADLMDELDGIKLLDLDVYALFAELFADPEAFGFDSAFLDPFPLPGPAAGCLFVTPPDMIDPTACPDVASTDPEGRFFWDEVHPTTQLHDAIGAAASRRVPEPGSMAFLVFGALAAAAARRRFAAG